MNDQHDVESGEELRSLLAVATEDRPDGIDLLRGVHRRATRRRPPTPVLAALSAAGVLGAVALAVTALPDTPSARAQVSAAASRTSETSFRIRIVQRSGSAVTTYDGIFDSTHRTGRLVQENGRREFRYLGDVVYTKGGSEGRLPAGKSWVSYPAQATLLARLPVSLALIKLAPQDPQAALRRLRSAANVREQGTISGVGWTGHRYVFLADDNAAKGVVKGAQVTGTVDVDGQGRVRRLELRFAPSGGRSGPVMNSDLLQFSDYGTHAAVTAPPAEEVIGADRLPNGPRKADPSPSGSPVGH